MSELGAVLLSPQTSEAVGDELELEPLCPLLFGLLELVDHPEQHLT